ncbi:MAG: hypothetical protein PHF86_03070 [Candidatus Nanoarchaeia archaeon]|jgi:hypothetical protein|nr:hypothetical protein [Candidatus Nanoarchaeia archaeon]
MNEIEKKYFDKLLSLTNPEKEIEVLCKELGIKQEKYLIFINAGGISYVIRKIASDIIFSLLKIDNKSRVKLALFHLVSDSDIFYINKEIEQQRKESWTYRDFQKRKTELCDELIKKANNLLINQEKND